MLMTGSSTMDAERAFAQASRARKLAAVVRRLRREPAACGRLAVYEEGRASRASRVLGGVREIPLEAIRGTVEPSRASMFDAAFRPTAAARRRWQSLWVAEHRGAPLPPISVVPVGDAFAVRDGHHRISVARARGAATIDAMIDPPYGSTSPW
jgi:hypothetical protein